MRCGCPECGVYLVHRDEGLGCACPNCLFACVVCMGGGEAPASKECLSDILLQRKIRQEYEDEE